MSIHDEIDDGVFEDTLFNQHNNAPSTSKQSYPSHLSVLKAKVQYFPTTPGVYKMLDEDKRIIYIGKAKDLKSRVTSYFNKNLERRITKVLMSKVMDIDYIVTESEKDALIFENTLIKKEQPFFNIDLKDDKSYPYLWLTTHEEFPRLLKSRVLSNKGDFFGPYTNVKLMNIYLDVVNRIYPLKKCKKQKFPKHFKPCLYFHIGKCLDYCTGNVSQEITINMVKDIKKLIQGDRNQILEHLKNLLEKEKQVLNYEKAKLIKYSIDTITSLDYRQRVSTSGEQNFDIINYTISSGCLVIIVLNFRDNKLADKHSFDFINKVFEESLDEQWLVEEIFPQFLFNYFTQSEDVGKEIIFPLLLSKNFSDSEITQYFQEIIAEAVSYSEHFDDKKNEIPKVKIALRGEKIKYLNLAKANASYSMQLLLHKQEQKNYAKFIKQFLKLNKIPRIIESFDIANTADQKIVAGMVRYVDGEKDKSGYRIFSITSTTIQNDFQSIKEAVFRRYRRVLDEGKPMPDLILIDGGKGQLMSAKKSLEELKITGQPIISLAKQNEEIYVPKISLPIKIPHQNPGMMFLIKVRDETHRFVNRTHVEMRDKQELRSSLLNVKGLGEKKIKTLLSKFNNLEEIKFSNKDTLVQLPYFTEKDAILLIDFLRNS